MKYNRKTVDIEVSSEMKEILKKIKDESFVANLLLKKRHNKDNIIDEINYISLSNESNGLISYLTKDRINKLNPKLEDVWSSKKRFNSKPGSFVNKLFKNIKNDEIEKFSNLFKHYSSSDFWELKIVKGKDISKYYDNKKHKYNTGGSINKSCMKYNKCKKYFDIYNSNPDTISMLVMVDKFDNLMGRALLWKSDGYNIMDKIYTIDDDKLQIEFKRWAKENNYYFKYRQSSSNTLFFSNKYENRVKLYIDIKLKNVEFNNYPYLDTFKFLDLKEKRISNYKPKDKNIKILSSINGLMHNKKYLVFDSVENKYIPRRYSIYLKNMGIYTSTKNVVWSEEERKFILESMFPIEHYEDMLIGKDKK